MTTARVTITFNDLSPHLIPGLVIDVRAYSGQVRPFTATIYSSGVWLGRTGFCKSQLAAASAGSRLLFKRLRGKP